MNSYNENLSSALKAYGFRVMPLKYRKEFFKEVLMGHSKILHFHWPIEITAPRTFFFASLSCLAFIFAIIIFKLRGGKVFWTLHNVEPHEVRYPVLEDLIHRFLLKISDYIFIHGNGAIREVLLKYNIDIQKKSRLTLHGNYPEFIHIKPVSKIINRPLRLLCIGNIREYKGFSNFLRAAIHFEPSKIQVTIAGKSNSLKISDEIKCISRNHSNIEIIDKFLSTSEMCKLLEWSDYVALPYKKIHTSGVAVMALSAARPMIAPNLGLIPEYVDDSCALLIDSSSEKELIDAIQQALEDIGRIPRMSRAARARGNQLNWACAAKTISDSYRGLN
jgi:glycosyltransferase involved in cell wall biosynthesis